MDSLRALPSLPPFAGASLRSPGLAAPAASADVPPVWFDAHGMDAAAAVLHVGADTVPRAIDDIERDFFAALCESHPPG